MDEHSFLPKSSSLFLMCVTRLALKHSHVHRKGEMLSMAKVPHSRVGASVEEYLGKGFY